MELTILFFVPVTCHLPLRRPPCRQSWVCFLLFSSPFSSSFTVPTPLRLFSSSSFLLLLLPLPPPPSPALPFPSPPLSHPLPLQPLFLISYSSFLFLLFLPPLRRLLLLGTYYCTICGTPVGRTGTVSWYKIIILDMK